jgi:hypothetical protein
MTDDRKSTGGGLDRLAHARDLDRLLDAATVPSPPEGAIERLMGRIDALSAAAPNVVPIERPLRRLAAPEPVWLWRPGLALLAASLLFGIYLGQAEFMSEIVGDAFTMADADTDVVGEAFFWLSFDPDALTEETL